MVAAFGFSVLLAVTALTYTNAPPIPDKVTNESGATLFTGAAGASRRRHLGPGGARRFDGFLRLGVRRQ
ncbi:MAG: hypothetical protein NUW21_09590 [Elusimicrobia bacterium]|nr:hypothetical protein [Elusimicrobiota bacterium]